MAGKSDVVVKLILVFFISLLSFSIGTFVGKKYSDNQHRLARLEPGSQTQRQVASTNDSGRGSGPAVSDEEIAKLAEEFAMEEESLKEETLPSVPTSETPIATIEKKLEPLDQAKSLAETKAPTESKPVAPPAQDKDTRIPSSLPPDVAQYSVGKFTVQIASYKSEEEAKKRADDMKLRGYGAFHFPAQVRGETWYRVGVGLFPTEEDAKNYRKEFSEKSKLPDTVIQKIVN